MEMHILHDCVPCLDLASKSCARPAVALLWYGQHLSLQKSEARISVGIEMTWLCITLLRVGTRKTHCWEAENGDAYLARLCSLP